MVLICAITSRTCKCGCLQLTLIYAVQISADIYMGSPVVTHIIWRHKTHQVRRLAAYMQLSGLRTAIVPDGLQPDMCIEKWL